MMNAIKKAISSILPTNGKRKLWVSIVAAICAFGLGLTGAIEWDLAIKIIAGALGGFLGVEGLADALGRLKTTTGGTTQ